ncbi:hypothetical protein HAZT_HAZT007593, partial [Hyalella azteca]
MLTEPENFTTKKEQFLANASNKQEFVNMLSQKLVSAGCHVLQAEGNADVLIAKTAVDTNPESEALYLQSDKKKGKKFRVWDIHWFQRSVGPEMCTLLPLVHAIVGCDTTSPLFGIGKGVPIRKLKSEQIFRKQARVFSEVATKDEIQHAGEEALVCLYGGSIPKMGWMDPSGATRRSRGAKHGYNSRTCCEPFFLAWRRLRVGRPNEGLDKLRCHKYCEKVSTSTSPVQVHTLPPTAAAA